MRSPHSGYDLHVVDVEATYQMSNIALANRSKHPRRDETNRYCILQAVDGKHLQATQDCALLLHQNTADLSENRSLECQDAWHRYQALPASWGFVCDPLAGKFLWWDLTRAVILRYLIACMITA
jgi:hypothetical protein